MHLPDSHAALAPANRELKPLAAPPVTPVPARPPALLDRIRPYVAIARPDHWFKNVFMLLGVLLVLFYHPEVFRGEELVSTALKLTGAVIATCLIASSNYVINEILDAATDRNHYAKKHRPIPSGRVKLPIAYAEWILLGITGLAMAAALNWPFFYSGLFLLVMGLVYNIPPIRSKELPYLDVLSEAINNPIRLLLGWFALTPTEVPPLSLLIAYWMVGAFFMASKRFAEYRSIGDPAAAAAYRSSFKHYTEEKLLVSMFFYTTCFALFLGVFIIRYKLELILIFPLVAGFVCYYLHISFKKESPVQNPERLYKERGLMAYLVVCVVSFFMLMFVRIPELYHLFNVKQVEMPKLWEF